MYSLAVLEVRSRKWVSLGETQDVCRAVYLLEALGQNHVLPFLPSRSCLHSSVHGPSLHLQSQKCGIFKSLSDSELSSSSSTLKDLCDYIRSTWIIQANPLCYGKRICQFNFLCNLNSPLPGNIFIFILDILKFLGKVSLFCLPYSLI